MKRILLPLNAPEGWQNPFVGGLAGTLHDGSIGVATITGPPIPEDHTYFDLIAHLHRQRAFSEKTFGPGTRTAGVCDHIRRELREIEAAPADITEWVDVILLALDGAWRSGATPEQIAIAIEAKQTRNELRSWPDWRTQDPNKAIEHTDEADG